MKKKTKPDPLLVVRVTRKTWIDRLTPAQLKRIEAVREQVKIQQLSRSAIASNIVAEFNLPVSVQTVSRWLDNLEAISLTPIGWVAVLPKRLLTAQVAD